MASIRVCAGLSSLVDRPKVISSCQNVFTFNWTELSVKDQSEKNFSDQQFECKGPTDGQETSADSRDQPYNFKCVYIYRKSTAETPSGTDLSK